MRLPASCRPPPRQRRSSRRWQRWPGFQVGSQQPISIGGYGGLFVEVTSTQTGHTLPDVRGAGDVRRQRDRRLSDVRPADDRPGQFRILEIAGKLLIIRTTDFPQESPFEVSQGVAPDPTRHAADQVALHAILDSLRFAAHP